MEAPCTLILVKQTLPFELLAKAPDGIGKPSKGYSDSDTEATKPTDCAEHDLYGDDLGPLG